MPELNPKHIQAVLDAINRAPFFRRLFIKVTELGVGRSVVELDIEKEHMNPFGGVHGGVYAAAIDTAAYWSAYCDLPQENGLVTIDLKVDFLAPVSGRKIMVQGRRIKAGKTIFLTEGAMLDDLGNTLAHGTSKLMVTLDKQAINDVVRYIGAAELPPKFLKG